MSKFDWTPEYFSGTPGRGVGRALCWAGNAVLFLTALVLLLGIAASGPFAPAMGQVLITTAVTACAGLALLGLGATCINVARIRELMEPASQPERPSQPVALARTE